jgi:nitrite reductase (NADH) small subunit
MPDETLTRAQEIAIGTLEQIPRGEGRNFEVAGKCVAVFRTHKDQIFATQAECPHRQGPLADGMLGGTVVMCPLHDRSYDLRTGKELGGDRGIVLYDIRQGEDGALLVTLS